MVEITSQEWSNWKQEKVTREFLRRLFQKREDLKEGLAEGQAGESEAQLHEAIGQCQAYKDTVDYAISSFEVILTEEEEHAV